MLDGNISVEEDTELRDLVVQTLESNGVLAKVRAELRASVFLALEEQESVMNPVPLLNKTVKQYLASSEGKLLFSLVREFLDYFGLNYTMSVYDPETYFGKEYNYAGRNKLCEELGINSKEPLLGEILKNTINGAFNNTQKNNSSNSRLDKTFETSTHFSNATFDVSIPKVLHEDSMNDNNSAEKQDSTSESSVQVPINVTITDKKKRDQTPAETSMDTSISDVQSMSLREIKKKQDENVAINDRVESSTGSDKWKLPASSKNKTITMETDVNVSRELNKSEPLIKFDESVEAQTNQNEDSSKQKTSRNVEVQMANNRNNLGKMIYFDEIIVDGKKDKVDSVHKSESLFGELPPLASKTNSIFSNLPPLNGKKTNINDLKELVEMATDGIDNYEEDFSSASGSTNEQSPSKEPDKSDSPKKSRATREELSKNVQSEEISEEIEDDLLNSTSCLDNVAVDKSISNFAMGLASDYIEEV